MAEEHSTSNWTDFIDQNKYELTGEALLFRNTLITSDPEPGVGSSTKNYTFSISPGDNSIFNQKPIALGFSAYIGHDEVEHGYNSLKSNLECGRGFYTEDYYRNYTSECFKFYCRKNDRLPRPLKGQKLEFKFYSEHLISEGKRLQASKRLYSECKSTEDRKLKEYLKEFAQAYLDWLRIITDAFAPEENQKIGSLELTKTKKNPKELSKIPDNDLLSEIPEESGLYAPEPIINGIHNFAKFLGIGPTRAQNLKNKGAFPYFQDERLVLFDPIGLREAINEYNKLNKGCPLIPPPRKKI